VTLAVGGPAGFFAAAFVAAGAYQLLLAAEVATALVPSRNRGRRWRERR
jgi:hypothetical protein